jgi:hypothetical protein
MQINDAPASDLDAHDIFARIHRHPKDAIHRPGHNRRLEMATQAAVRIQRDVQDVADNAAEDNVLVHVRYYANGGIGSIGEKPEGLGEREWLDRLLAGAPEYYQVLAGGRGFFRIPRSRFTAILQGPPK